MSTILLQSNIKLRSFRCVFPWLRAKLDYCLQTKSRTNYIPSTFQLASIKNFSSNGDNRDFEKTKNIQPNQNYSIFHKYKPIMDAPPGTFAGSSDRFNGVTVESEAEYCTDDNFECKLENSLKFWKDTKRRCIWFKVKTEHSDWIPLLIKRGFDFHHARPGYAMLCFWLPTHESPNLPKYAHTMLGVGGVIVNEKNEILVVRDRYAQIPNSWKLPGGFVEPKENIIDAAIREVREETGIDTTFVSILSLRHTHISNFDCSDIYVVIALKPKNLDIQAEEREITKAEWMPVEEFLQHPQVHETNRHFLKMFLDYQKRNISFSYKQAVHKILKVQYALYYVKSLDEQNECT